jgi:hypothetical protein
LATLGAERDATWSLDSDASGFEKMASGLNVTPADYARFGSLFLHGGMSGGRRMPSSSAWAARSGSTTTRGSG